MSEQISEIISKCSITSVLPEPTHKIVYKFFVASVFSENKNSASDLRLTKFLFFLASVMPEVKLLVCIQRIVRLLPEANNTLAVLPVYCQK